VKYQKAKGWRVRGVLHGSLDVKSYNLETNSGESVGMLEVFVWSVHIDRAEVHFGMTGRIRS
jgi:hypothetical protein